MSSLLGFDVGRPSGDDWSSLDALVGDGTITQFIDATVADNAAGDHPRDAAGVSLATQLSSLVVRAAVGAYLLDRRGLRLVPETTFLHRTPEGAFDRLALAKPSCVVLPGDPAVGGADVDVLDDQDAMRGWIADRLVATLSPLLTEIRKAASYGLRGLWGNVADGIGSWALLLGRAQQETPEQLDATWNEVEQLFDELADRVPQLKSRPRPFPVQSGPHATMFQVRCTCCLLYKVPGRPLDGDGPRYCTTCPLIDDELRTERIVAHLTAL